jgi:hypothetical protein
MQGIHPFFIAFPKLLPINNTTLKLATYLEEALGITKYDNLGSGIPYTIFMSVLLDHCSRKNNRDPSICYNLSREFAHKLHYFQVGHLPIRGIRKQEVPSPVQRHYIHKIHVISIVLLLNEELKGFIYFYNLSQAFAHKLHYFKVGHLPRRGIGNHEVSSPG